MQTAAIQYKEHACPLFHCYICNIANLLPFHPGSVQLRVLGRAPAGLRPVPGVQPVGEQRLPAASAQPQPDRPAEGAGGLWPVEDRAQQQRRWRRRAEVRRVFGAPALGLLAKKINEIKKPAPHAYTEICWWNESRMRATSSGVGVGGLGGLQPGPRRTQRAGSRRPSPHIWWAGAGSGLGRRSDRPNEISQHTKCLSGPIRIPSCLPWVYLIEGKREE